MPRTARIVNPGYPHHITQRGNNKQAIFKCNYDRQLYLNLLKKYSCQCGCKVHSYCLMSNHLHLLLVPDQNASLARTMQKINTSYAQYINKKYDRTGTLWEGRFFSTVVDKEAYLWTACRYVEQNPLRAGIVDEAIKYKWSSARISSDLIKSNFVEPVWEKYLNKNEYIRLLAENIKEKEVKKIRESTSKGIPFGSKKFLRKIIKKCKKRKIPEKKVSAEREI